MRNKILNRVVVVFWMTSSVVAVAQSGPPATKKKTAAPKAAASKPTSPPMEARAIDILKATSLRLAQAHNLSFNAVEIFEHPSRQGDPLAYSTKYEVKLQRPDKLKVVIAGDGPASEFYYNGKTMMAYAPAENLLGPSYGANGVYYRVVTAP